MPSFLSLFSRRSDPPPEKTQARADYGSLSNFSDPFTSKSLSRVEIEIRPGGIFTGMTTPRVPVQATVYFRAGGTSGNHEIPGQTLEEVVVKVRAFLAALDGKT